MLKQVQEEVVVGLGFLEVWELSGPSNHFLLICKKHTGIGAIPDWALTGAVGIALEEHSPFSKVGAAA